MRAIVCLVLMYVVGISMAQRSSYATRPVGIPDVLSRFKDEQDNLPNRLGETNTTQEDQGPLKSPEGSMGDPYLLQQVPKWPREHQPFWYLNQQHIMDHRGQAQAGQQPSRQPGEQVNSQQGGQINSQQGGQVNSQQGGQASQQPNRQPGGQVGQQPNRQPGRQVGRQPSRQPWGQAGRQPGGQASRQPSRLQGTQQWNNSPQ